MGQYLPQKPLSATFDQSLFCNREGQLPPRDVALRELFCTTLSKEMDILLA